jgi:mono/diheme cytochrome c family protein
MSNETVFFILAGALVLVAVVASFVGLRLQKFPASRALLVGGTLAVALLVVATTTFAWRNAEDEQAHMEAELAEAATENADEGDTIEADEEEGSNTPETSTTASTTGSTTEQTTTVAGDPAEGAELFNSQGCSGCHTLAAAESTGTTGPNLDGALADQTPEMIKTSIVDPNDDIAQGYPPDVMPQNFGDTLSESQIDSLVAYLVDSTSGGSQ